MTNVTKPSVASYASENEIFSFHFKSEEWCKLPPSAPPWLTNQPLRGPKNKSLTVDTFVCATIEYSYGPLPILFFGLEITGGGEHPLALLLFILAAAIISPRGCLRPSTGTHHSPERSAFDRWTATAISKDPTTSFRPSSSLRTCPDDT